MRTGPSCPPEALALSSTFFSPSTDKGSVCRPARLLNPGCFLKQDVCLRPPSPQINNPQKPDFRRQGGSTRVTLFPHPISWSTGAPEGMWAARHWEGWGLQWKPEALCQTAGGDTIAQGFSVTEPGFAPSGCGGLGSLYHTIENNTVLVKKNTHRRLNYKRGNTGVYCNIVAASCKLIRWL